MIGKVELKTCNKCQATEFDNTAVFCQNCGERFIINSSNKYNLTSPNKKQPSRNLKKKKHNRRLLLTGGFTTFIFIIIISFWLFPSYFMPGTLTEFSITSANVQFVEGTTYKLNISMYANINGYMQITSQNSPFSICTTSLNLNNSYWDAQYLVCSGPFVETRTYSGSYNYSLSFTLILKNSTIYPVPLNFSVYSELLNVSSQNYYLLANKT